MRPRLSELTAASKILAVDAVVPDGRMINLILQDD